MVSAEAAQGQGSEWKAIADRLHAKNWSYEFEVAQAPLAGTSFTRQALRAGANHIVVVGNDRLVHDVVNGFYLDDVLVQPDATLGIIPSGRRTDTARGLGLARGLKALETAVGGTPVDVDLAKVTCLDVAGRLIVRYFVNLAEIGNGLLLGLNRLRLDRLGAVMTSVTPGLDPELWTGTLTVDDGDPQEMQVLTVLIASGPLGEDGAQLVPGAKMDDGLLDLVLVEPMGTSDLAGLLPRVLAGTHLEHPKVHWQQVRRLAIETLDWPFIELDGQREGAGGVEIAVLPRALRVHVGRP
jgi:diacylglycerol kinase (ATP)